MLGNNGYLGRNPGDSSVIVARQVFNPTGVQTSFVFATKYQIGYLELYLNGAKLITSQDYNGTDGTNIVLTTPAQSGDVLEAVSYKAFNAVIPTDAPGNFTVDGNLLVQGDTELVSGVSTGFISAVGIQSGGNQIGTGITTINFIGVGNTVKVNGTTVDVSIESGASGVGTAIKYPNNQKSPFSYINATTYVTENIVLDTTNAGNDHSYVVVQEPRIIVQTGAAVTVGLGKTLITDLYQLGNL
jgi:hypothetical protein